MHRTAGTLRVFEAGSELWQFPVFSPFSPQPPVTQAVGRFIKGHRYKHMDDMDALKFLGLAALFMVIIGLAVFQEDRSKSKVRKTLEEMGFNEIKVISHVFSMQRGTLTFDVEYRDKDGGLQRNSCIVPSAVFSEQKIYWEKPIE